LNKYKSKIIEKQKIYYNGLFSDAGNNSKKKWNIVKSILGRNDVTLLRLKTIMELM
jgi:hypothetical protein